MYKNRMDGRNHSSSERPDCDGRDHQALNAVHPLTFDAEASRLLEEMTTKLRGQLPEELKDQFNPEAPRMILETEDTQRVADGYLPAAGHDRAVRDYGPPSFEVAAMETVTPGLRWPGGRPEAPRECLRLYEMQVDFLAKIAWGEPDPPSSHGE